MNKYTLLVKELTALDTFCRDRSVDWEQLAKTYGYRKPKTAYFSRGGCFYALLLKVYNKINM